MTDDTEIEDVDEMQMECYRESLRERALDCPLASTYGCATCTTLDESVCPKAPTVPERKDTV